MSRCKICRCQGVLDPSGRCQSCADVAQAAQLGLHYGDYMAKKIHGVLPPMPRRARAAAALLDYAPLDDLPKCRICGNTVFPPRRLLCSSRCEVEDKRIRARTRKDPAPRICPVCGKPVEDRRRTYCCEDCTQAAKREHDRLYRSKINGKWSETHDKWG